MKLKRILSLLIVIPLLSCSVNTVLDSKVFYFDTLVDIELYEGQSSQIKDIKEILKELDALSDNYHSRDHINNVYTINSSNEPIQISHTLYDLIDKSLSLKELGISYFNPLIGSLSELWKSSLADKTIPSEIDISNELEKINNSSINLLDDDYIDLVGDAKLDLGGIAKGYALDLISSYLKENKIKKYLINAGSSSILLGSKNSDDGYFNVGISDLKNAYLKLKNCYISTSSKSVQGVTIGDTTYSHIINPTNGSAININDAVIVISDIGYLGDALSTSMMLNSVEEIKELENKLNVKTIVIKDHKKIYSHKDLKVYYH